MSPNNYREHWRRYRKLRNLSVLLWAAYVPAVLTVTLLGSAIFNSYTPGFVLGGAWLVVFLVVGIRFVHWPCPRCGQSFSGTWWSNKGLLAKECAHCGLPKFADGDGGSPPRTS